MTVVYLFFSLNVDFLEPVFLFCFLLTEDELVINPKEFPDVSIGDILEIFHPDEDSR